jgi:hypothetical protein
LDSTSRTSGTEICLRSCFFFSLSRLHYTFIIVFQADIQKVLRTARKLPEKQQQFYKELNRLRKAALSFGFYEVLQSLAQLLERECTMLPDGTHPDAAMQLTHVVKFLASETARDANQSLLPLRTNFTV